MGVRILVFFFFGCMCQGNRLQTASGRFHPVIQPSSRNVVIPTGTSRATSVGPSHAILRPEMNKASTITMHSERVAPRIMQNVTASKVAVGDSTASIAYRATSPLAAMPSLATIVASCVIPSCLGFWKNGYTVSYAYGAAMAIGGFVLLSHAKGVALAHAAAYIFYGVRLILFLLYREIALPESVHQMVNRPASLGMRLKRLPVILGCAFLYFCMLAPLHITASLGLPESWLAMATVGVMWAGIGIAALGDLVKSAIKAKDGMDTLVTAFPFNILRHPNYTGEFIGWTASFAASLVAVAAAGIWRSSLGWLTVSATGTFGIMYVLMQATSGLEKKQKEKYNDLDKYQAWLKRSWSGPSVKSS